MNTDNYKVFAGLISGMSGYVMLARTVVWKFKNFLSVFISIHLWTYYLLLLDAL